MLNPQRAAFVFHYPLTKGDGTKAAILAGYSPRSAHVTASRLLNDANVRQAIAEREAEMRANALIAPIDVARAWKEAATVDRNELLEVRRVACRYCYGKDHLFQETPAEYAARKGAHDALLATTPQKDWARIAPFADLGGVGYDKRKDPHPDCPECFGDGDMHVVVKDTRKLSKNALAIFEGVKITRDGLELKMMSKADAIENLAKHLGMLDKRSTHVVMNPDGTPVHATPVQINFVGVYPGGKPRQVIDG